MSFALLIIGITLIVAAVRNTQDTLVSLVVGDFSGDGNFVYWVVALLLVGSIGYVPRLKPLSDGFLVLILLALILSRGDPKKNIGGGFFKQFTDAIGTTKATGGTAPVSVTVGPSGVNVTKGTGKGDPNPPRGRITSPGEWTTLPDGTTISPTGW